MMYELRVAYTNKLLFSGTKYECDTMLSALRDTGLKEKDFVVAPVKLNDVLSETTRQKVIDELTDVSIEATFGDGCERDYILNGATIIGLNQMTDEDLLDMLESHLGNDNLVFMSAKAEAEAHKMLRGDSNA